MSNQKYDIEKIYKSKLEDFEMDVPKNAWANISNNINTPASSGFLASSITQLAAVISAVVVIGGVVAYSLTQNKDSKKIEQPTLVEKQEQKITPQILINKTDNKTVKAIAEIKETELNSKQSSNIKKEKESTKEPVLLEKSSIDDIQNINNKTERQTLSETTKEEALNVTETETNANEQSTEGENKLEELNLSAEIVTSSSKGYAPLTVEFSHNSENVETNWNFGDGEDAIVNKIEHTYNVPGTYTVELEITNKNRKTSVAQTVITVLPISKIESIPNIFTPNNDGNNDLFVIKSKNLESYSLIIFDSKGTEIFESTDLTIGWNGLNKYGEQAQEGNYFYLIKAIGIDGEKYTKKGTVRLER